MVFEVEQATITIKSMHNYNLTLATILKIVYHPLLDRLFCQGTEY